MGLGREQFIIYKYLYNKKFFKDIKSVIELGSQTTKEYNKKDLLVFLKSIGSKNPKGDIKRIFNKEKRSIRNILVEPYYNIPTRYIYEVIGISDYYCIDTDGMRDALPFDLNKDIKKEHGFNKQYDLVTNLGTSEHIFNQYMVFKNVHELTSVDGYMLHFLPFNLNFNHGFFTYQPNLFMDLAIQNDYELHGLWLVEGSLDINQLGDIINYSDDVLKEYGQKPSRYLYICCLLKKIRDKPFVIPFQNSYIVTSVIHKKLDGIRYPRPSKRFLFNIISKIINMRL
jgi:hypothetical protein